MADTAPGIEATGTRAFSVAGRSVLITGATGAMGSAVARALAAAGARLTLAGGNEPALKALADAVTIPRPATIPLRPDTPEAAAAMVERAVQNHGRLDGVLVASGMNHVKPITDMDPDDWQRVQDANVKGSWLVCQAAGRQLIKQQHGGSVILVSSTRGRLGHPAGYSAYCPSKAAVDLLAKTLAAEWGGSQIRVNAVAPTVFRSDLTAWMYADDDKGRATREAMLSRIPLGRLAEPDDLTGAVQFLLSDASAFITGQVLYLDGGYTAC
jgi:NAD(P)-dependent dehydrogenase (short-subunit alcohol dehydrogenase family)